MYTQNVVLHLHANLTIFSTTNFNKLTRSFSALSSIFKYRLLGDVTGFVFEVDFVIPNILFNLLPIVSSFLLIGAFAIFTAHLKCP